MSQTLGELVAEHEQVAERELVVLLGADGAPIGSHDKATVHHEETPLHLAFSSYLFNDEGQLLLTRRAVSKKTWPGVWTNSACGHPAPGEDPRDAIVRRARTELGAEVTDLRLVLPEFRYRAVDASGVVENEICPVWTGRVVGALNPDPAEVEEWSWVDPAALVAVVQSAPRLVSPWAVEQVPQLVAAGAW